MLEAKTTATERPVAELARRALSDLLAYRQAFRTHLRGQDVWGLGVVWGRELDSVDHQVRLCTPDRLRQALDVALGC